MFSSCAGPHRHAFAPMMGREGGRKGGGAAAKRDGGGEQTGKGEGPGSKGGGRGRRVKGEGEQTRMLCLSCGLLCGCSFFCSGASVVHCDLPTRIRPVSMPSTARGTN